MRIPILSISGSDCTGQSGIQADIQTIAALGGYAVTAVTCIAPTKPSWGKTFSLSSLGELEGGCSLSSAVVLSQVSSIINILHPRAIKVGLVTDSETIRLLRDEVIACHRLVVAPGIYDAEGTQMIDDDVIRAIAKYLVPEALLLMLRCKDAEKMLGMSIQTDDDMVVAARQFREMGAEWVLLRGGCHTEGRLTALLFGPKEGAKGLRISEPCLCVEASKKEKSARNSQWCQFFTSYNTKGWQRHGVAGALSAAITVRLGMGDGVPTAIRNAHDFIHSQVVYAKDTDKKNPRSIDLYNAFVSLVAELYYESHDVSFYADKLCITRRYLSQITAKVVGKSPKQIIVDYLLSEAKSYLETTRLTVKEIAGKLGFSSQSLFCKFFKNQTGISPTEYRSCI